MPDDLDLLELAPAPPVAPAGTGRRRLVRLGGAAAVVALAAGVAVALTSADDPDRTAIDNRPVPTLPPAVDLAPVAPGPGGGPARPAPGPVVEDLALQPGGGVGPFAFGARRADVLAATTARIGAPVHQPAPARGPACADARMPATWTTFSAAMWDDLTLRFAGPGPDDQHLVAWTVVTRPAAERRFRLEGGPAFDDPLSDWGRAYGPRLEVGRLAGDRGQVDLTVHLPGGDVSIVGHARASGRAVVARAGTTCGGPAA